MSRPPLPADVGVHPALEPWLADARADLADHLGIDPEHIVVTLAALVTWPDSSCGCPQPGMRYLQVTTDGAYAELVAGGATYAYHAGGRRPLFRCDGGTMS